MKLLIVSICILLSNLCFAQLPDDDDEEDSISHNSRIDTLLNRKTLLDSLISTKERQIDVSKVLLDSLISNNAAIDTRSVNVFLRQYDSLKDIIDSQKTVSNTIKTQIDSLKKVQATEQSKILQLMAEIAKKDDSAHVIAKIKLRTSISGKTYKVKVHVDGIRIIDKLNYLNKKGVAKQGYRSKKNFSDYPLLRMHEMKKPFMPYIGFGKFKDTSVEKFITDSSWKDNIPIDYSTSRKFSIEEVRLNVFEGMIREINVKTSHGIFRNMTGPIDLVHIGQRLEDRLYRDGVKIYEDEYLLLGEVIDYTPVRSNNDLPYTQFDITLTPDTPNHVHDTYTIKESTSINTYFDVAVFSDIKGLSGDANGIAQTTLSAKFITYTRNFRNTALIPLNFVSFMGGLSKFDKDFTGTILESGNLVNRKDLLQRSNYHAGLKLNLLHWILSPLPKRLVQDMQLNVGYNFVGSKVLNITEKGVDPVNNNNKIYDSTYNTVTHNMVYFEPIVSFNRYRNFNMAVSLPFYFIDLKESSGITNRQTERWAKPSIELMYYSKRSSSSKIFFRYNHWIDLNNKQNAFTQMQLGISANLGDLFKSD